MKIPEDRDQKSSTLCYIEKDGCYLMMHRVVKENDINHDKWIGVGGHFEEGESADECLLREVREECGIQLSSYRCRGLITFVPYEGSIELMHLYTADVSEQEIAGTLAKKAGVYDVHSKEDPKDDGKAFSDSSNIDSNGVRMNEGILEWVPKDKIWDLELWEGDKIFFRLFEEDADFENMLLAYDENDQLCAAELEGEPLELIDVANEDGSLSGVVQERNVVHKLGTLHRTVHMWILRKNDKSGYDVLLQKRSMEKDSNPGCYDISAAGHIERGGSVIEAAIRETYEEIGLETTTEDFEFVGVHHGFYHGNFHGKPFNDNELMHVFICNKDVDENDLTLQESEVESIFWMDFDECRKMIREEYMKHCIYEEEFDLVANHLSKR